MDTITLERTLPRVFSNEEIPGSDIWRQTVQFRKKEVCLVEAASGGGKSSMCSYIYGARTDYEGRILFDSTDAATLSIDRWLELRRTSLAYLPQDLDLFPELSAFDNIMLKNRLTNHVDVKTIGEWLDLLGLSSRTDFPVGRMSIGQQQRVAIIRALCQPFDFLIIDEPVSHLDARNNEVAARLIASEAQRQGAGVIVTSVGNHLHLNYTRRLHL